MLPEGDFRVHAHISIHALREEGDFIPRHKARVLLISIHALREEGDRSGWKCSVRSTISIHALREEGDRPVPGSGRP